MRSTDKFGFTRSESRTLRALKTPAGIQKFLDDLPKTRNAKIMRRILRAAYLNQNPGDLSALENPQSAEAVRNAR